MSTPSDPSPVERVDSSSSAPPSRSAASLSIPLSVPEAVRTLTAEPRFRRLVRAFAGNRADAILRSADDAQTEHDFQATVGKQFLEALIDRTATRLTYLVDERIRERPACLFISNHRDIVLDTALLNNALISRGCVIPHVAIGDNLLQTDWMVAFYRLCRAFVIRRELSGKQLYEQSRQVSDFVRNAIRRGESVWMAQRPGRTKDGADKTEPGLLRMLLLAYERTEPELNEILHVTPVAVSYEFEPCDVFKAAALIGATTKNAAKGRARHDAANIMRGLVQQKGRIHVEARPPILVDNAEARARGNNRADFILELAQKVDREICGGYVIWSTNYLAHDLLEGRSVHADRYSAEEKERFQAYVAYRSAEILAAPDDARMALLSLYARPVTALLARQGATATAVC